MCFPVVSRYLGVKEAHLQLQPVLFLTWAEVYILGFISTHPEWCISTSRKPKTLWWSRVNAVQHSLFCQLGGIWPWAGIWNHKTIPFSVTCQCLFSVAKFLLGHLSTHLLMPKAPFSLHFRRKGLHRCLHLGGTNPMCKDYFLFDNQILAKENKRCSSKISVKQETKRKPRHKIQELFKVHYHCLSRWSFRRC